MTTEDEIVEIVKRTVGTKLVNYETYQITSFPALYILRMQTSYSIRLKGESLNDEMCIEKFEKLKEIFETKRIELRNLIIERIQTVILARNGSMSINKIHYHDCIFTSEEPTGNLICHNCVYYNEDNK